MASCPGTRLAAAALLLAVAGGSRLLAEAGPLFAVRPAWWDTAIPKAPPAAQLADPAAAWSALQSTNNPWQRAFDGWRLAAPFDGRAGRGMDDLLPPEKSLGAAPMTGKGGATVAWQEWKPGQPCPVRTDLSDSVLFAYKAVQVASPVSGWIAADASGRFKVWLDGRPLVPDGRSGDYCSVPCELPAGTHRLLVKLDCPSGRWSFRLAFAPDRPEWIEIRCRTEVLRRWPDNAALLEQHGPRLAALYARLADAANFRFWVVRTLSGQTDVAKLVAQARAWDGVVADRPEMASALNAAQRDFLQSVRDDAARRDAFGDALMRNLTLDDAEAGVRAFRLAGYQPPALAAENFLRLCVASNRAATAAYWAEVYARRESNPARAAAALGQVAEKAGDLAREAIYAGVEQALVASSREDLRPALAGWYAQDAVTRADSSRLDRLLELDGGRLRREMPFQAAMWDLEAARIDLDQDRARGALAVAVEARPAYSNTPAYLQARIQVFKMRAGIARPGGVVNDPEDVAQTLARFARQNELGRLYGYIRRQLTDRSAYLVADANDNNLFVSAKTVCRQLFAPYADGYAKFLAREVADLAGRPGQDEAAARLARLAGLAPASAGLAPPLPPPARPAAQCALPGGVFGAVAEMPPGLEDARGEDTRSRLGAWQPVLAGAAGESDGLLVVQNSRSLAALAGGALRWSQAVTLAPMARSVYDQPFGGLCRPAFAGGLVAARLDTAERGFALFAFDARSGVPRWRWSGAAGEEPAGSPAAWRGTHFLVPVLRRDGEESALDLVAIAADTGRETLRLQLAATPRVGMPSPLGGNAVLRHERTLAAPAVAGDVAYVDTGLGMVCAADLLDESVRWARLYQRKFDAAAGAMRVASAPVVGRRNVFFAPVDSRWLLFVDRETGALSQRRTDLAWSSAGACGADRVAVTTPSSVQILALDGGAAAKPLDLPHLLYVAPLADGCALAGDGMLAVVNAAGECVRRDRAPAGAVPAWVDASGRWWGWGGADGSAWGRLDDSAVRRPARVASAGLSGAERSSEALVEPSIEGAFTVCRDVVGRAGPDGRLRWEMPRPSGTILEAGRRVVTANRRRVWCLDDASGEVRTVWPPLLGSTGDVAVAAISTRGNAVYALTAAGSRSWVWDLGAEGREPPTPVADLPLPASQTARFWVQPVATQLLVLTRSGEDREVRTWFAPYDPASRLTPPPPAVAGPGWGGSGAAVWMARNRHHASILVRRPAEIVHLGAEGLTRSPVGELDELWTTKCWDWGELFVSQYGQDETDRVIEPHGGASVLLRQREKVGDDLPLWWWTGRIGTELFGLRRLGHNRMLCWRQDLGRRAAPLTNAFENAAAPAAADEWRGAARLADGRALLLMSPKSEQGAILRGYAWDSAAGTLETVLLPGTALPAQSLGTNLWRVGEWFLTPSDWSACAALERLVRTVPATTNYAAVDGVACDGFPDEWRPEEFAPTAQGRAAVRRGGNRGELFCIVVEVTDPAAAAALASAADPLAATRFWMGRGQEAGFDTGLAACKPLPPAAGASESVRSAAWQVSPDGRRATLEIVLSLRDVPSRRDGDAPSPKSRQFGDLALRLFVVDPAAGIVELAGLGRPGPAGFVRLLLP